MPKRKAVRSREPQLICNWNWEDMDRLQDEIDTFCRGEEFTSDQVTVLIYDDGKIVLSVEKKTVHTQEINLNVDDDEQESEGYAPDQGIKHGVFRIDNDK